MRERPYTLIRSSRKTVAIQITPEGNVLLRCPRRMPEAQTRVFLEQKRAWIERKLAQLQAIPQEPALTAEEVKTLARQLKPRLQGRLEYYAPQVGVSYGRVTIRSQKTRWGSCSGKGNLNFNCLLALCPEEVLDYIVVHELCHRRELNHSARFWAEVERVLPDYRQPQLWLKTRGPALIRRLPEGKI